MYRQQEVTRVFARSCARLITQEESDQVTGGISIQTKQCTIVNCSPDGDCPPIGCPPA